MPRLILLAPPLALLAALLFAGPALAVLLTGTRNGETLTGTTGNDHITGAGGDDTLEGRAGNDTYFFADNWGNDTLVEKSAEGIDTLNFRGVTTGTVTVRIVRQWRAVSPGYTSATGPSGSIAFTGAGNAVIEKVIGGQGQGVSDHIETGGGAHTLMPGGGAHDSLKDYAGWNDGAGGNPEIPASNDTYKGFAHNTGFIQVQDWGGTGDVVDLRPLSTEDTYLSRVDLDGNPAEESLQIVTGPSAQVLLLGHYSEYSTYTTVSGQQGRIETLIFADATVDTASEVSSAILASARARSGKQAELAKVADRLAQEARRLLAKAPKPGTLPDEGRKADKQHDRDRKR
jgi:hypothetical protein